VSPGNAWEKEAARVTSEVARRAIRRLDVLEWVILAAAVGLAVGGGALLAWLLTGSSRENFRLIWMITSVLLFVVPGGIVLLRTKTEARRQGAGPAGAPASDDG
jgi:hypothetical protein